jgi:hypothetical protein
MLVAAQDTFQRRESTAEPSLHTAATSAGLAGILITHTPPRREEAAAHL